MSEMIEEPRKEHHWLERLLGSWRFEGEAPMVPGEPPMKFEGTEIVRSLGGLWVVGEGKSTMPDGTPTTMLLTLGYDPNRACYVGTFVASMMTHLWTYTGSLDAAGRKLTLDAEGPDFTTPGKLTNYKDSHEIISADERILRSVVQGHDGKWHEVMTAKYVRNK